MPPLTGPVDVALNSLTSPAMVAATLASLSLNARMAEISKRDIWSPQRVAQERPDVGYRLVAIDFLPPKVLRSWPNTQHCIHFVIFPVPARSGHLMKGSAGSVGALLCP